MNPLTLLPFLFLSPKEANLNTKYFQANINNYNNIICSTGNVRVGNENNIYLNRDGLLNLTAGTNLKIKKVKSFYTITQSKTKNRNENSLAISEILTNNQSIDFGIYLNKIGYEQAVSNKSIEGKVILKNPVNIGKFNQSLKLKTEMLNIGLEHGYFKLIKNKELSFVSSVDYKYLNWTFDGEHNGYISSSTKPITFFAFSDGKIVIQTDDYSDLEKYLFHKKIEDKNRDVNRIYDLENERNLEYLSNPLFSDRNIGFRIEYKDRVKSEIKLNFKNMFGFTDFNKRHLIGFGAKGVFLGFDVNKKELFVGYKK